MLQEAAQYLMTLDVEAADQASGKVDSENSRAYYGGRRVVDIGIGGRAGSIKEL